MLYRSYFCAVSFCFYKIFYYRIDKNKNIGYTTASSLKNKLYMRPRVWFAYIQFIIRIGLNWALGCVYNLLMFSQISMIASKCFLEVLIGVGGGSADPSLIKILT